MERATMRIAILAFLLGFLVIASSSEGGSPFGDEPIVIEGLAGPSTTDPTGADAAEALPAAPTAVENADLDRLIERDTRRTLSQQVKEAFGIDIVSAFDLYVDEADRQFRHIETGNTTMALLTTFRNTLETLPACFRRYTRTIANADHVYTPAGEDAGGQIDWETGVVYMSNRYDPSGYVLVHEMTHAFQMGREDVLREWQDTFWDGDTPRTPSPTDYGNSHVTEDMAESVATYWYNGPSLQSKDPQRYAFIKDRIMGGMEYGVLKAGL